MNGEPCEFTQCDTSEWWCETHQVLMIQRHEPVLCVTARIAAEGKDDVQDD